MQFRTKQMIKVHKVGQGEKKAFDFSISKKYVHNHHMPVKYINNQSINQLSSYYCRLKN